MENVRDQRTGQKQREEDGEKIERDGRMKGNKVAEEEGSLSVWLA